LVGRFARNFSELGRNHSAGPAPGRPKINQHRYRRMAYQRVKGEVIVNVDRLPYGLEFALTLAAAENLAQTFISHAIAAPAFRTV
jgi:hypothetical protein